MQKQPLLFDENLGTSPKTLSGQLWQLLATQGWQLYSVHDIPDLVGHPDEDVIAYAKERKWALLTLDKRMAYLSVRDGVSTYLILHERRLDENGEVEEYTVVHLDPFANVEARKSYDARIFDENF